MLVRFQIESIYIVNNWVSVCQKAQIIDGIQRKNPLN